MIKYYLNKELFYDRIQTTGGSLNILLELTNTIRFIKSYKRLTRSNSDSALCNTLLMMIQNYNLTQ